MDVLKIIQENALTVRCLPKKVVTKYYLRQGETLKEGEYLEYYNPKVEDFSGTMEQKKRMYKKFREKYGEIGKPIRVTTRRPKKGGWWYVAEVKDTRSTVLFGEKNSFYAPTLEEAINLYLESKQNQ